MSDAQVLDPRFAPVAHGAGALQRLCTGAVWSEGPVWIRETSQLLWSDIPNNRMLCWHADHGMTVWRDKAEFTNGHVRDVNGDLLHCSHGLRAVMRTRLGSDGLPVCDAQGQPLPDETVVSHYQGRRLNSPNDVVVTSNGSIWFTDPPYGILSNHEGYAAESEQGGCYVFRFDLASGALCVASDGMQHPNGLAFSPDERVLYVSDTSAAVATDGSGHHHILAFDVQADLRLAKPRLFAEITPGLADGFRVDVHGFVYTSSQDSVQVFHPDGTRIGRIPVPEKVGNLVFGGAQGNELFICASTSLYRIVLNTRGATA